MFVAALGFSQLLFARAAEDMKSRNWLACHRRMFAFYGGVSHVTVPWSCTARHATKATTPRLVVEPKSPC